MYQKLTFMRKTLLLLASLWIGLSAWAGPVSRNEAKMKASEFMASRGVLMTATESAYHAPRKAGGQASEDQAYYYVFNAGNNRGYVIVSGDDRTESILGYSDKGSFDVSQMPEHMMSFLQGYADEIQALDDAGVVTGKLNGQKNVRKQNKPVMRPLAPLMSTKWNQGDPYNRMCPEYYNGDGSRGRSATGCVATALAQVMGYWKYPSNTRNNIPEHSVSWTTDDGVVHTETMPAVKRGTAIDWANIRDTYSSANTEAENNAIALLMMLCGQSMNMGYGPSSGAVTGYAPTPLKNYFGYDKSVFSASRAKYTVDEWHDLIYGEIAIGHPVMFGGHSTGGGHAFVLDGYDGEGLFHVNWGWGGGSDGYFRLVILNPGDNSGIGASSSSDGYSMSQTAIINVMPATTGTEAKVNDMTIDNISLSTNAAGYPTITSRYINWTGVAGMFETGIGFMKEDGTFSPIGATQTYQYNINVLRNLTYTVMGLSPGTYKVAPIARQEGREDWAPAFNMKMEWFDVHVDENLKVTAQWIRPVEGLTVTDLTFTGNCKSGTQQTVDATFTNTLTEYYGTVYCFASQTDAKGTRTSCSALSVKKDEFETITFFFKPDKVGTWNIWITADEAGNNVLTQSVVEITANGITSTKTNTLAIQSNSIANKSGNSLYGGIISGTLTMKNNGKEPFDGIVRVTAWRDIADEKPGYFRANGDVNLHYQIPAGGTQALPYFFSNKEVGRGFCLSIHNVWADVQIQGLNGIGTMENGVVYYLDNGNVTASADGVTLTLNTQAVTIDLRGCSKVKNLRGNIGKGTILYVNEDAEINNIDQYNVVVNKQIDELNIYDGSAFLVPEAFTANKVVYHRTFAKGSTGKNNWDVLMVPFAPESITCDGEEMNWQEHKDLLIRQFDHLTDNDEVIFEYATEIEANIPYVAAVPMYFEGKEVLMTAENVNIEANLENKPKLISEAYNFFGVWNSGKFSNVYAINADGTAFERVANNVSLKGMRAYFVSKLPEEAQAEKITICDEELAIQDIHAAESAKEGKMFDLQGRRIDGTPAKGTYIIDGRKVIVK